MEASYLISIHFGTGLFRLEGKKFDTADQKNILFTLAKYVIKDIQ